MRVNSVNMAKETENNQFYENEFARVWIENKILCCEVKPNVILTRSSARSIVYLRNCLQEEAYYAVYCDIRGIIESDQDSRDFITTIGFDHIKAISFLVTPYQSENLQLYLDSSNLKIESYISENKEIALKKLAPHI